MATATMGSDSRTNSIDVRLHRLEKKVARLRIARVATPSAFTTTATSTTGTKRSLSDSVGDAREVSPSSAKETFVPKQAPISESKRLRRAAAHDRAWIADFWIELLLVLLGLNVGPLLFWYFAKRTPSGSSDSADFLRTGTGFVDRNLAYLLAPTRDVRSATMRENLPQAWGDGVTRYGPLFALCTSLFVTALMLWSKPAIVHTVKGMAQMRAATITHLAIAWAWMNDLSPTLRDTSDWIKTGQDVVTIAMNISSWITGPVRMLIGYIVAICFSHLFAGVAQAGALLFLLFAFSGLEKWWETGSFSVDIPDPDDSAETPVSGGGKSAAATAAAAVFGGGGGWDSDDEGVVPMGRGANVFSAAAAAAAEAVKGGGALSATSDDTGSEFLDAVNRGSFRTNKFAGPLVLALFAAVKMVGAARMKTRAGSIFAWTASSLVGLSNVGTIAMRAAPAPRIVVNW